MQIHVHIVTRKRGVYSFSSSLRSHHANFLLAFDRLDLMTQHGLRSLKLEAGSATSKPSLVGSG